MSRLLFADDTALVAESAEQLQCLVREFGRVCKRRKLRVNVDKSKVMSVWGSEDPAILKIMLNGERMEMVNSFKYLGNCFSSEGLPDAILACLLIQFFPPPTISLPQTMPVLGLLNSRNTRHPLRQLRCGGGLEVEVL